MVSLDVLVEGIRSRRERLTNYWEDQYPADMANCCCMINGQALIKELTFNVRKVLVTVLQLEVNADLPNVV